ncbi:MAG: amidophosphoribosyltransferase [Planctomyces sp.]|nr:amidophosphoribosyltransferase [Planctomyces sp.]
MAELHHECGVAAIYHLPGMGESPLAPRQGGDHSSWHMPRLLLEIQNRGQLAAGMTSFDPSSPQILETHKDVGTVSEVFDIQHQERYLPLMQRLKGPAAIGHVRYATCGKEDRCYAHPFERTHIEKNKWFSFAFNGQIANYTQLMEEIQAKREFHLARQTDTEILMHLISQQLSGDRRPSLVELLTELSKKLDGAYNIVFLNALGEMFVARDPLGLRPLCYAIEGSMFAAASESVALSNLGFKDANIHTLPPGHAVIIQNNKIEVRRFAETPKTAHCFFEWIYFANVASTLDDRSVYLSRKALGEELAAMEDIERGDDLIVVPVPDTSKAAADAMAYKLGIPSLEGLIRNRYIGRTFIEGKDRADKARLKYTPLREVLEGKRVLLVEDTIVRSTTMQVLISQLKERGGAKEVHVRVACPPIVAPCFYGIDMSSISELFAPRFIQSNAELTDEVQAEMARVLGADSLRYLPLPAIARSLGMSESKLCRGCLTGEYPTPMGEQLYQLAVDEASMKKQGLHVAARRTYEQVPVVACSTT